MAEMCLRQLIVKAENEKLIDANDRIRLLKSVQRGYNAESKLGEVVIALKDRGYCIVDNADGSVNIKKIQ